VQAVRFIALVMTFVIAGALPVAGYAGHCHHEDEGAPAFADPHGSAHSGGHGPALRDDADGQEPGPPAHGGASGSCTCLCHSPMAPAATHPSAGAVSVTALVAAPPDSPLDGFHRPLDRPPRV